MSKPSKNYRAEFKARHKATKRAMREADKAAEIAVQRTLVIADAPRTTAHPGSTREAQRRLRQLEARQKS